MLVKMMTYAFTEMEQSCYKTNSGPTLKINGFTGQEGMIHPLCQMGRGNELLDITGLATFETYSRLSKNPFPEIS